MLAIPKYLFAGSSGFPDILLYLCFYLHHIEKILNGRIYRFLHREGLYAYDPVRLLDYKLNCVAAIMECLPGYDPEKGADFLTYAYYDIGNAILNCRRYEECIPVMGTRKEKTRVPCFVSSSFPSTYRETVSQLE